MSLFDSDIKRIFQNFSFVGLGQLINMIVPLIVYPILIRRLGSEAYGKVIFVLSLVQYISIFINFGINSIGVKEISSCKSDSDLSRVFSTIYSIRIFLLLLSSILSFFIFNTFFNYDITTSYLFYFSFTVLINDAFFPSWFFQGVERVKILTSFILLSKIVSTILIIAFINSVDKSFLIPLFYSIGYLVSIIFALYIIFRDYEIKIILPQLNYSYDILKRGFPLLISQISLMIKDKGVIILSGIFFSNKVVAYYDLASKIINIYLSFYNQLPIIALPRVINSDKPKLLFKKLLILTLTIGLIVCLGCLIIGKYIILLLGSSEMLPSVVLLYMLSPVVIIIPLNTLINYYYISNGMQKKVMFYTIFSASLFLIFCSSLIFNTDIKFLVLVVITASSIELLLKFKDINLLKNNYE